MPTFVTAVNRNGVKQRIPIAWLDEGSPFADDFALPPSVREGTPAAWWKVADLRAWAEAHRVNIDGAETKADMLAIIASA